MNIKKRLKELAALESAWDNTDEPWDTLAFLVSDTADRLAENGILVEPPIKPTVLEAKAFFAKCVALKGDTNADTLNIEQAAKLLGCRPKTLRKLVDRTRRGLPGGIRFHQVRSHSLITFRRAWIDEFLTEHSQNPTGRQRQPKSKPLAFSEF